MFGCLASETHFYVQTIPLRCVLGGGHTYVCHQNWEETRCFILPTGSQGVHITYRVSITAVSCISSRYPGACYVDSSISKHSFVIARAMKVGQPGCPHQTFAVAGFWVWSSWVTSLSSCPFSFAACPNGLAILPPVNSSCVEISWRHCLLLLDSIPASHINFSQFRYYCFYCSCPHHSTSQPLLSLSPSPPERWTQPSSCSCMVLGSEWTHQMSLWLRWRMND